MKSKVSIISAMQPTIPKRIISITENEDQEQYPCELEKPDTA